MNRFRSVSTLRLALALLVAPLGVVSAQVRAAVPRPVRAAAPRAAAARALATPAAPLSSLARRAAAFPAAPALVVLPARAIPDAPSRAEHPVLAEYEAVRAAGINPDAVTTSREAASLAQRLPEGPAKRSILLLAQASMSGGAGGGARPDSAARVFDGGARPALAGGVWGRLGRLISGLTKRPAAPAPSPEGQAAASAEIAAYEVPLAELRWTPDDSLLPESTRDVEVPAVKQVIGQDPALRAIEFGLKMGVVRGKDGAPEELGAGHYNLYVSGVNGTGRSTAVGSLVAAQAARMRTPGDIVVAPDFERGDSRTVLVVEAGRGAEFAAALGAFAREAIQSLPAALESGEAGRRKAALMAEVDARVQSGLESIRAEARGFRQGRFALDFVPQQTRQGLTASINITFDGKAFENEADLEAKIAEGAFTREELDAAQRALAPKGALLQQKFSGLMGLARQLGMQAAAEVRSLQQAAAQGFFARLAQRLGAFVNAPESGALADIQERAVAFQREFSERLKAIDESGFGLAFLPTAEGLAPVIVRRGPDGDEPVSAEMVAGLIRSGELTQQAWEAVQARLSALAAELVPEFQERMQAFRTEREAELARLRSQISAQDARIAEFVQSMAAFSAAHYEMFLGAEARAVPAFFAAKVLVSNAKTKGAPVVRKDNLATLKELVDAIAAANGGFLELEVSEVLRLPGGWPTLMRAVRTGSLHIDEGQLVNLGGGDEDGPAMGMRRISYDVPVKLKVILKGSPLLKMMISQSDEDFGLNFNAVAELQHSVEITPRLVKDFVGFVKTSISESGGEILDFSRPALSAFLAHAARLADTHTKLSLVFGDLHPILREASHWAREAGRDTVAAEDIERTLVERRERNETYRREFLKRYVDNVFVAETDGRRVGQINGLAVMGSFGVVSRVSVAIEPGPFDIVSLDQMAENTGKSFNKSVQTVKSIMARLFGKDLAGRFRVSFEQNYGGIDGDSATDTILQAVLSAASELPIGQMYSITGSLDQFGNVQAIGGVNEKIEGFFELAKSRGLTGSQGVIIPRSNVADLQLSAEVVQAVREGKFHIYAVDREEQALAILMGTDHQTVIERARDGMRAHRRKD